MLIPLGLGELSQKYGMHVRGVLHIGAHLAEEAGDYEAMHWPVVWVEANPDLVPIIEAALAPHPNQRLVSALVTDQDDVPTTFNVTNYQSMSSSVLEFGTHPTFSPDTVFVETKNLPSVTIDSLCLRASIDLALTNMLVMDMQGAELMALRGAQKFLEGVDYIYTEVNTGQVYKGCAQLSELDQYLDAFDRVETFMTPNEWGDAFYVRR